jgi:hypothetical protein
MKQVILLYTVSHFHPNPIYAGKDGAYPSGVHNETSLEGYAPNLARKY